MNREFWEGLLGGAKGAGVKPRQILLIVLAALTFGALIAQAPPLPTILAAVTFYCLDPLVEFVKSSRNRRNMLNNRSVETTEFKKRLQRKRETLQKQEPELPLELPTPADGDRQ